MTIPLTPRTGRALDLVIGERIEGPVFLAADGRRLDRHAAGRIVRRPARGAGIAKLVAPHTLRHSFITAALDAGVPLRDVQEAASHRTRGPRCGTTGPAAARTGMPPTSSPPTSRAPLGSPGAGRLPGGEAARKTSSGSTHRGKTTHRYSNVNANRRYGRQPGCRGGCAMPCRTGSSVQLGRDEPASSRRLQTIYRPAA